MATIEYNLLRRLNDFEPFLKDKKQKDVTCLAFRYYIAVSPSPLHIYFYISYSLYISLFYIIYRKETFNFILSHSFLCLLQLMALDFCFRYFIVNILRGSTAKILLNQYFLNRPVSVFTRFNLQIRVFHYLGLFLLHI